MNTNTHSPSAAYAGWQKIVANYQQPDVRKSIWQIVNSFGGYFLGWILMGLSLHVGYWLTLLLAIPIGGLLVRIFIIQHDCGHGSFFKSKLANNRLGPICASLTLVPYRYWRRSHAIHHATHAELEERGTGDIWTMTVDEFMEASRTKRIVYRVFRNPIFLFIIAPTINFLILWRFPLVAKAENLQIEKASFYWNNLAIAAWLLIPTLILGIGNMLLILVPIVAVASSAGTYLFYMQHQFEETYWDHTPQWDYTLAAMHGSSYYKMPRILQWFSGNIGFHHIHHLSPRIPNYNLEQCYDENPIFQEAAVVTPLSSWQPMFLTLWDEKKQRLVTFREALEAQKLSTPQTV